MPLKDIRPVFVLNVLSYSLVECVLLFAHNLNRILRKACRYHAGTAWAGDTRWGCTALVNASCTSKEINDDDLPNWGALVW